MPRKCFLLDIETKHFFLIARFFFLATRNFFLLQAKNSCAEKKYSYGKKKDVLSLYQENIFLASKNISMLIKTLISYVVDILYIRERSNSLARLFDLPSTSGADRGLRHKT